MDLTSDYGTTKETDNYTDNFKLNLKKVTRMQAKYGRWNERVEVYLI